MAYNIPVLRCLVSSGFEVIFIHRDNNRKTPHGNWNENGVSFIKKSTLSNKGLVNFVNDLNPDLIFISDRTIPIYNKIGIFYSRKIPVISGCDSQWSGGRQWINVLTAFARHKQYYSHIMVAGLRQYEYARRLGFKHKNILWPLYSADTDKFGDLEINLERYCNSKDILFVGRLQEVKGLKYLLEAWSRIKTKGNANLHIVGKGDFFKSYSVPDNVVIHNFLSQQELASLALKAKSFILPSLSEPWGVVIHEFAAAGLPIITTDVAGASSHLVIDKYNGFIVSPADSLKMEKAIIRILEAEPEKLLSMGSRSRELSKSISPKLVASAIISCLK